MSTLSELEAIDKIKTKMLKYIMYKKRTEKEVRQKFNEVDELVLEEIIAYLKENGYIDDTQYIKRAVNEYINLKNLSIKEISYKLQAKGIDKYLLEEYISNNIEELEEYEKQSAENLYNKKFDGSNEFEVKQFLLRKGFKEESIKGRNDY